MNARVRRSASITEGREKWTAVYQVMSGMAVGSLLFDGSHRKEFAVGVRENGFFGVGIGSSGTKMYFQLEEHRNENITP